MKKAVVLLSGGIDSSTALGYAVSEGFEIHPITFDYGQRHRFELRAAGAIARSFGAKGHKVVKIDLRALGGSALTDSIDVPKGRTDEEIADGVPVTYVPARNLIFLSVAVAYGEVKKAADIFWGANAVDYSGYPDCRREFVDAFSSVASLATRWGIEGNRITVHTPLLDMTKGEIIKLGLTCGVDFSLTHSCYDPSEIGRPCGGCDACLIRAKGFEEAGVEDPILEER